MTIRDSELAFFLIERRYLAAALLAHTMAHIKASIAEERAQQHLHRLLLVQWVAGCAALAVMPTLQAPLLFSHDFLWQVNVLVWARVGLVAHSKTL